MDRPFIEELHIQNYGCIRDATFTLTPLHALIGPNDSGKSSVLRALRTLAYLNTPKSNPQDKSLLKRSFAGNRAKGEVAVEASTIKWVWRISCNASGNCTESIFNRGQRPLESNTKPFSLNAHLPEMDPALERQLVSDLQQALGGAQLLRLDPDALRAPTPLTQEGQPLRFEDQRGTGLPAVYDAIMVRDLPAFIELNKTLSRLFPSISSISLTNPTSGTKAMGVKLVDGTFVPAELMSEGLLYYLAFAAIPHLEPTAILLVEEPENGLHPARIAEVMRVLREISKTTQVLIATHSPLVINELKGDEVTVVTRPAGQGTKATLMKDTPNFDERSKVYALGELWVSYANGEDEAPLLQGGPRP